MFPSPTRPRAPSPATLRVLYQLAYISSGTALGLGALCAEERRRRTTVVQRIADNAKRLRQCPRYGRAAALSTLHALDAGDDIEVLYTPHTAEQADSSLAPELPSVVAREYGHNYSPRTRTVRRNGPMQELDTAAGGLSPRGDAEHAMQQGDADALQIYHPRTSEMMVASQDDMRVVDAPGTGRIKSWHVLSRATMTHERDKRHVGLVRPAAQSPRVAQTPQASKHQPGAHTAIESDPVHLVVQAMDRLWRRTRNIDPVLRRYGQALEHFKQDDKIQDVSRLHHAMAYIALDNRSPEQAQILKDKSPPSETLEFSHLLLSALDLAHRGAWNSVEAQLIGDDRPRDVKTDLSAENVYTIGKILQLYFQAHSSDQSLHFCEALATVHGYSLGRAPAAALLRVFVSEKRIDLLDHWLSREQRRLAIPSVDGWLAADLLRQLVKSHHPNHVWMIEQSRDLLAEAPELASDNLTNLLIQHTAFDIRSNKSQHASWQSPNAAKRLRNLLDSRDPLQIPSSVENGKYISQRALDQLLLSAGGHDSKDDKEGAPAERLLASQEGATPGESYSHSSTIETSSSSDVTAYRPLHFASSPQEPIDELQAMQDTTSIEPDSAELQYSPSSPIALLEQYSQRDKASNDYSNVSAGRDPFSTGSFEDDVRDTIYRPHLFNPSTFPEPSRVKSEHHRSASRTMAPANDLSQPRRQHKASRGDDIFDDNAQPARSHDSPNNDIQAAMLSAFSTEDYTKVIAIHNQSRSTDGLPSSYLSLELALEASLRLHNGCNTEAVSMLKAASDAGMNTTCAMGPILMHRNRNVGRIEPSTANNMCREVTDYYRENAENAWPVKHYLAVDAAHRLSRVGYCTHAISILESVFSVHEREQRPIPLAALQVWLESYARLKDLDGMQRIVDYVLAHDLWIDESFVRVLQRVKANFQPRVKSRDPSTELESKPAVEKIDEMRKRCIAQRAQYKKATREFSRLLVAVLVKHARGLRTDVPALAQSMLQKRLAAKKQQVRTQMQLDAACRQVAVAVA